MAFQPSLPLAFAKHLHNATIGAQLVVLRIDLRHVAAVCELEQSYQRFELFSSGPKRRKFEFSRFSFMTSQRNAPIRRACR